MKKIAGLLLSAICVYSLALASGCTNTASLAYNQRLTESKEYSFNIIYTDSNAEAPVYISCYKDGDDYAYRFSLDGFDNENLAYRQIFDNGIFYEICEKKLGGVWCGEYKKTENVAVTCEKNFMYKYTNYITSGSFLTLLGKGEKVTYKGRRCTQSDIAYESSVYTFVFDDETSNLVKFVLTGEEGEKTLEYSDYKFDDIDKECFNLPSLGTGENGVLLYREVTEFTYKYFVS